jgi:hypothetical protein
MTEKDQILNENIRPIETEVGFITGRDAIFLDTLKMVTESEFCIAGGLMGTHCSKIDEDIEIKFSITFKGVLLFKMLELDFDDYPYASCFDLIENSSKLAAMRKRCNVIGIGKMDSGMNSQGKYCHDIYHQHFIFRTYDTVFEIIAQSYDLVIGEPEAAVYVSIEDALKSKG